MKESNENNEMNIEELVKGFKKASDILRMEKPDYIFAPVCGAVPFIDILNVIDRKFRLDAVKYLPNSSRFGDREGLMREWYSKFYDSHEIGEPMKIMCIDEVLSGSSAVVGYKQFRKSIEERARKKAKGLADEFEAIAKYKNRLNKQIEYKILGISERGHDRNHEFKRLDNKKIVYTLDFDHVPTIDDVKYNTLRFKELKLNKGGRMIYSPEIERFDITPEYMTLLRNIASYVGVDPSTVNPVNFAKIEDGLKQSYKTE